MEQLMCLLPTFSTDTAHTHTPVDGAADELVAYYRQRPDLISVPQDLLMTRPVVRVPDLGRKKEHDEEREAKKERNTPTLIGI